MNTIAIYLIVLVLILIRTGKEKEIQPSRMWITPALFAFLGFSSISQSPQLTGLGLLLDLVFLAIGIGIGVWRGSMEKVGINSSTGKITSQGTLFGTLVFIAILLLRVGQGIGERNTLWYH
ncbi:DUF1453 family protein [Paenibacillus sp. N1-5-1-14]|uniref:CcdC protein domain-containing protein n=1 Tax=Paenibacillus radicibacter TaxID=2972488 RepID=UPI0021596A32|nr:CcdC protein domain-containing protein [Paenibacillus radicibacter]MCR8644829.1 DUF1453 family protein [Paenibacillus radicibacter]